MPNDNIMGIPTRACINGFTKEDTERLKNALVKQILNDKTVVDVTDDGKIILANDDGLFLSVDDTVIGLFKDGDDNVIPITVPYLPEDENENPLVPPSGTIMTSDNIAVDPRIVRTVGNQNITGNKEFLNVTSFTNIKYGYATKPLDVNQSCKFYELTPFLYGSGAEIKVYNEYDLINSLTSRFVFSVGTSPNYTLNGVKVGMNSYKVIIAKRVVDNVIEVWIKNISIDPKSITCELRHIRSNTPVVSVMIGEEPTVGDVYSEVREVTT